MSDNCTSCGRPIPAGQGSSCSMCYGDMDYGNDGYARAEWEASQEAAMYEQQREEQHTQPDEGDREEGR